MKKSLLALAVLAGVSMLFMGCPKGTDSTPTSDPAVPAETAKPFTIQFSADKQWSAAEFTVQSDWKSLTVVFADDAPLDKIQFCLVSDKVEKEESWGTAYYSKYPKAEATTTIDFAAWLDILDKNEAKEDVAGSSLKDKGATKINKANIQNMTKDAFSVKIKSAKVTKTDGTVIDVVAAKDWASNVIEG